MITLQYIKTDAVYGTQQIFRCNKPITKSIEYDDIKEHLEVYRDKLLRYIENLDKVTFSKGGEEIYYLSEEDKLNVYTQYECIKDKLEKKDLIIT